MKVGVVDIGTNSMRLLITDGATEEGHNASVHGMKWYFEPSWTNSGWKNSQMMGISEHFELIGPWLFSRLTEHS